MARVDLSLLVAISDDEDNDDFVDDSEFVEDDDELEDEDFDDWDDES